MKNESGNGNGTCPNSPATGRWMIPNVMAETGILVVGQFEISASFSSATSVSQRTISVTEAEPTADRDRDLQYLSNQISVTGH